MGKLSAIYRIIIKMFFGPQQTLDPMKTKPESAKRCYNDGTCRNWSIHFPNLENIIVEWLMIPVSNSNVWMVCSVFIEAYIHLWYWKFAFFWYIDPERSVLLKRPNQYAIRRNGICQCGWIDGKTNQMRKTHGCFWTWSCELVARRSFELSNEQFGLW